jgi:hypothetical protein
MSRVMQRTCEDFLSWGEMLTKILLILIGYVEWMKLHFWLSENLQIYFRVVISVRLGQQHCMRERKEHNMYILHACCQNPSLLQCSCPMGQASSLNWRQGTLQVRLLTAQRTARLRASFVCFDWGWCWNIVYKLLSQTERRRHYFCWLDIQLLRKILSTLYVVQCLHYTF